MNVLRDTLIAQQVAFLARCTAAALGIAGFGLIFWQNWVIAVGLLMILWASELAQKVDK